MITIDNSFVRFNKSKQIQFEMRKQQREFRLMKFRTYNINGSSSLGPTEYMHIVVEHAKNAPSISLSGANNSHKMLLLKADEL